MQDLLKECIQNPSILKGLLYGFALTITLSVTLAWSFNLRLTKIDKSNRKKTQVFLFSHWFTGWNWSRGTGKKENAEKSEPLPVTLTPTLGGVPHLIIEGVRQTRGSEEVVNQISQSYAAAIEAQDGNGAVVAVHQYVATFRMIIQKTKYVATRNNKSELAIEISEVVDQLEVNAEAMQEQELHQQIQSVQNQLNKYIQRIRTNETS